MELNDYMTVSQYAEDKKISVQAVYQAIRRKTLSSKMIGNTLLIPKNNP